MTKQIDWMGRWYEIIKERGENDRPTLGRLKLSTKEIDWLRFSHSEMDGVGAFVKYYRERGIELKNLPQIKEDKVPGILERFKIFYRLIFKTKKAKVQWKQKNDGLAPADALDINWHIFYPEQVKQIKSYCKAQGFSLNAYFMNTLTKSLLSELSTNQEGTWTLPVNMRPLVSHENFYANHSSGILISMNKNDTPIETQQKIVGALKAKLHWGIWWVHQIGKIVGMPGMRYISRQNAKKSFLIGSFSILGKWEFPEDHIWIGSAPGSKNFPITAYLLEAHEHISFCLKIHPYILKEESRAKDLFNQAVSDILRPI